MTATERSLARFGCPISCANSTWTKVTLTTQTSVSGSSAFFKFYQNGSTGGSQTTAYVDAVTVREDTLATTTAPAFEYADDLVVNNTGKGGITILGSVIQEQCWLHFGESSDAIIPLTQ